MNEVQKIMHSYHQLSSVERLSFYIALSQDIDLNKKSIPELEAEIRFNEGEKCMHCGSTHFVKNGRRGDGVQRYLCRDCGRSFLAITNSIVSGTHKKLNVWMKYFQCMKEGATLEESAQKCDISVSTAFQWRHRILDCMKEIGDNVCLGSTVEADETFFDLSYKGNHKQSSRFTMPRAAHRRGGEVHSKGLSAEKVCVMCAVNEQGVSISKVGKLGKVSSECVDKAFSGRISNDAVLVTDNEKAYRRFSEEAGVRLVQMETGQRMKDGFNIQRINAYHSRIKGFVGRFHGVSTKYLNNYLVWYNLLFSPSKDRGDTEHLLFGRALSAEKRMLWKELPDRPAVPVLVQ